MPTAQVTRTIAAPVKTVFQGLTDHASYSRFQGIQHASLLKTGPEIRDGVGAMRRIEAGRIRFQEEITEYVLPDNGEDGFMSYLIVKTNLPIVHQGGRMQFIAVDDNNTKVVWKTTFDCTVPIVGQLMANRMLIPQTQKMFGSMLKQFAQLTENK